MPGRSGGVGGIPLPLDNGLRVQEGRRQEGAKTAGAAVGKLGGLGIRYLSTGTRSILTDLKYVCEAASTSAWVVG